MKILDQLETLRAEATQVPGHSSYWIHPSGVVISGRGWRGMPLRVLKQFQDTYGYWSVSLNVNGKTKRFAVHRLMAVTFLPPRPTSQHQVRHLDGNKANNSVTNILWGTAKENAADRDLHGRTATGKRNGATYPQVKARLRKQALDRLAARGDGK